MKVFIVRVKSTEFRLSAIAAETAADAKKWVEKHAQHDSQFYNAEEWHPEPGYEVASIREVKTIKQLGELYAGSTPWGDEEAIDGRTIEDILDPPPED